MLAAAAAAAAAAVAVANYNRENVTLEKKGCCVLELSSKLSRAVWVRLVTPHPLAPPRTHVSNLLKSVNAHKRARESKTERGWLEKMLPGPSVLV